MSISVPESFFDLEKLKKLGEENAHRYQTAKPFSHIYFDDFLDAQMLEKVLAEFPDIENPQWQQYKSEVENGKLASTRYELIPPHARYVLDQLNTPPFLQFLETLTGIKGLIPDPYYTGGGMHQTKPGGWLGVHVDFNKYEQLGLYRRINVLLYLNKDYRDEYGGHLELWDEAMEKKHGSIAPIFNRCAIFTTSENSHHGHPDPLQFPEGVTRKSLAWYYYTTENGENIDSASHTTLFKSRPGKDKLRMGDRFKKVVIAVTPPIVLKAMLSVRNKLRS